MKKEDLFLEKNCKLLCNKAYNKALKDVERELISFLIIPPYDMKKFKLIMKELKKGAKE